MQNRKLINHTCNGCSKSFKSRQYIQSFCNLKCYVSYIRKNQHKKLEYKVNQSGCWIWTHGKASDDTGYGQVAYNGRCMGAHRFSWILHNGKVPKGKHVLHTCDVRMCVNPNHLFLGSQYENMQDASKKGRMPRGEENNMSKLTKENVINIRKEYTKCSSCGNFKVTLKELGKKYGVSLQSIHHAVNKKNWKHI